MATQLQIDQMTITEKLRVMEELWQDLRTSAGAVPVPQWHKDVLDEREQLIESGDAQFEDWDIAKTRITEQTS